MSIRLVYPRGHGYIVQRYLFTAVLLDLQAQSNPLASSKSRGLEYQATYSRLKAASPLHHQPVGRSNPLSFGSKGTLRRDEMQRSTSGCLIRDHYNCCPRRIILGRLDVPCERLNTATMVRVPLKSSRSSPAEVGDDSTARASEKDAHLARTLGSKSELVGSSRRGRGLEGRERVRSLFSRSCTIPIHAARPSQSSFHSCGAR